MSCLDLHSHTLHARGYRMTPQRVAILQALHDSGHLSPSQVYNRVQQTGMTEATVYRTLEFLADNGIVYPAQIGSGHLTYELAGDSHHHLVCRSCGAQLDLPAEVLRSMVERLEERTGYCLDAGHLTFFGTCPKCKKMAGRQSDG